MTEKTLKYFRNVYVVDIEATGLSFDSRIHVLSCGYYSNSKWNIISTNDLANIKKIFEDPDNIVVGHNFEAYDIEVIKKSIPDLDLQATIIDTLYLSQYLREGQMKAHGLEAWGDKLGYPKVKIDESEWQGLTDPQYNLYFSLEKRNRNALEEEIFQSLKTFKEAHYARMVERCETDVQINIKVWEELILSLYGLYEYDEVGVQRILSKLKFKSELLRDQRENPIRVDLELLEKNLRIVDEIFEEKKAELETIMPQVPQYAEKKKPKIMYKKDGSLSANAIKWYEFLEEEGLPPDCEGPVKYVKGFIPPNGGSDGQIKDLLFSLGWKPINFKFSPASGNNVPQVRIDGEEGKELCPSVLNLIEKEPKLKVLEGMSVAGHRRGLLRGFKECVDENGYMSAGWSGITKTWRITHTKPISNLPNNKAELGELVRSCLIAPEGMLWVNADLSSLEDKTKQCCIIDLDPEYVSELNVPGYDAHLSIGLRAGFFDQEDVDFFKWRKDRDRKEDDCPIKFLGREAEFEQIMDDLSRTRQRAKTVNYACFVKEMLITMPDLSSKRIDEVNIGEYVIGEDKIGNKVKTLVIDKVPEHEAEVYLMVIEGVKGRVECTGNHRWLTKDSGYKALEDLERGEMINVGGNTFKEYKGKKGLGYKIVTCLVTETSNFYIEPRLNQPILTGNCTYGAGVKKISQTAECSMEEAKTLVDAYWGLNWSVKHFAESCTVKEFEGTNYIWSPFTRMWLKVSSDHMRFSAVNQNFGATVFDVWCYFLRERGIKGILGYHDELSWYIPDSYEEIQKAEEDVKWAIDQTNKVFNQPIKFEAEPEFAKGYGLVH